MKGITILLLSMVFSASAFAELAEIEVSKTYTDGSTDEVEIFLDCNSGIIPDQSKIISPGSSVIFVVTDFPSGDLDCRITETGPAGYDASFDNGSTVSSENCEFNNIVDTASLSCVVTNSPKPALIHVSKVYSDGTIGEVNVHLDCNSGLIPEQNKFITPISPVTFVTTNFPDGELDCRVTEDVPAGYEASYDNGSVVSAADCTFNDLGFGADVDCVITNTLLPRAEILVTKVWSDGSSDSVEVTLDCNTGLIPVQSQFISSSTSVVFVVTDFTSGDLDCRVTEDVPAGYSPSYDDGTASSVSCEYSNLLAGASVACEITNSPFSADEDRDGVLSVSDNCPAKANAFQGDNDNDKDGDACDADDDNDGAPDSQDNCPFTANPDQQDSDNNGTGDACEGDRDGDNRPDSEDNCVSIPNKKQFDFDGDGQGDACDADQDNDGVANSVDACRQTTDLEFFDPTIGCSFEQLCPCSGPKGQDVPWRNHAEFVDCAVITSKRFKQSNIITGDERSALRDAARASDCGR